MNPDECNVTDTISLYAFVLAGGRSTRMGCDKRFLKYKNEYLIDRAIRICGEAIQGNKNRVLISGDVPGYECIHDFIPNLGPISGFKSCLERVLSNTEPCQQVWALAIPVDMPLLSLEILKLLVDRLGDDGIHDFDAICFEGYELPMLIHCSNRVLSAANSVLNAEVASQRSIQSLLKQLQVKRLTTQLDIGFLANANEPTDWEMVCRGVI